MWIPIILISGVVLFVFARKGITALSVGQNTQFRFARIEGIDASGSFPFGDLNLDVVAEYSNPTRNRMTIEGVQLRINTESGKTIGRIDQYNTGLVIEPMKVDTLKLPIKISYYSLLMTFGLNSILNVFNPSQNQTSGVFSSLKSSLGDRLKIEGTMRVQGVMIPINQSIPLNL